MNKFMALLVFSMGVPSLAATYTIAAGSSAATIQEIVNTAGAAAGNTVMFSAGSYSLASTVILPCLNGTVYSGPNVGWVTPSHRPSAILSSTVTTNYALQTNSNGTTFTGNQGCTIEYLLFSGTQGGIYVTHPASGIVIQYDYFTLNDPPVGGTESRQAVYLDGLQNEGLDASTGASYITIQWNVFYNNCARINAEGGGNGNVDSQGSCAATIVAAYNNHLVWNNNTVNTVEEGLKFLEQSGGSQQTSLNADVENNNLQGNSRIMIESQQDTNGVGVYSHNAFYQPQNPNNGTFELSIPEYTASPSPTHTADDNVFISNVPITGETGVGAHYGLGLELWGAGSIATNNLFQGGNLPESSCGAGWGCTGWTISVGEPFTNATVTGNYFSGTDTWGGTVNDVIHAVDYEDGASSSNAGIVVSDNTVVETSTTIPTVAPSVSPVSSSAASTVTLSDSDTSHGLSIFYTTDGTNPAIFTPGSAVGSSQIYTGPFAVPAGTIVKAIASWGQGANQGIVFPSFGYIPSPVVTGVVTASGRTLKSFVLRPASRSKIMITGGTMQLIAYATYSDGSTGTLPDAEGNKVTGWNTTNHKVARISSLGHATGLAAGTINLEASAGAVKGTPWTVTVGATAAAATAAAAAAAETAPVAAVQAAVQASPAAVVPAVQASPAAAIVPTPEANPAAANNQPAAVPAIQSALTALTPGPAPTAPAAALPDAFLGPFWSLVTPAGGSASISNSHLFLGVPGGGNHDPLLPTNQAVRVVQTIGNGNFDVAIKIDSPLFAADGNTSQGLMVLSDNEDFFTFALATDGSKVGLKARIVAGGVATTVLDDTDFSQYQNPMYLRVTKSGSAYVALYSVDGESWTEAASFTDAKACTSVGPFASNYNDTPANATPVVMSVNWFDVLQ